MDLLTTENAVNTVVFDADIAHVTANCVSSVATQNPTDRAYTGCCILVTDSLLGHRKRQHLKA